jgi:hypothetical protein
VTLGRLFHLEPGQLPRALPFFAVYGVLFTALSLLDGLSLALFVQRVGAAGLPTVSAAAAGLTLTAVLAYMTWAERFDTGTVFTAILVPPMLVLLVAWGMLAPGGEHSGWLAVVFVCREVTMTMVLLHFGNFLRDLFPQADLARIMPFVYAGGRVGGLVGGRLLETLARPLGTLPLLGVVAGILLAAAVMVTVVRRRHGLVPAARGPRHVTTERSLGSFAGRVWSDPLLRWITLSTIAFFACRTFLAFRVSGFFEAAFDDDVALSAFLGRYVQAATLVSIVVQLLFAARWIGRVGLGGAHVTYAAILACAALLAAGPLTFATAVFGRFVESELRYALRNPVAQLTVNLFPRSIRLRARAWSLGLLIPLSTCAASGGFAAIQGLGSPAILGGATAGLGGIYLLAAGGLARTLASWRSAAADDDPHAV